MLVICYNIFKPSDYKKVFQSTINLNNFIKSSKDLVGKNYIFSINGKNVENPQEQNLIIKESDIGVFKIYPGGDKIRGPSLGALGLLINSPYYPIGIGAVFFIAFAAGLLPLPGDVSSDNRESPTYDLKSNVRRVGEAIPVIYGRHIVYPDLAAKPYNDYVNNTTYRHYLFAVGIGNYEINQIRIDDSAISNFANVTTEIIENNAEVTLFNPNYTSCDEINDDNAELKGGNIQGEIWLGGFIINPAGTSCIEIAIDIAFPEGLFKHTRFGFPTNYDVSFRFEYRQVDSLGVAINNFTLLGFEPTVSGAGTFISRRTWKYPVPAGRYEVRVRRLTDSLEGVTEKDKSIVTAIKAKLDASRQYGDITLLAVRLQLTNSQKGDNKINLIVTKKIPAWNNGTWGSPSATSSIVWACADVIRSSGVISDEHIDLQNFYELDQILTARGDYFNGVFDSTTNMWEALESIARAGRAVPILQGGVLRLIRDREQAIAATIFTMNNIVQNSLKIKYTLASDEKVDGVKLTYIDGESWNDKNIAVDKDGAKPKDPLKIRLFGCTNEAQARREALYIARNNIYARKTINLTTELDGFIAGFGDLVHIYHDIYNNSVSGEIFGFKNKNIILTEPVVFIENKQHFCVFRNKDGSVTEKIEVDEGIDNYTITLKGDWSYSMGESSVTCTKNSTSFLLYFGTDYERTFFAFTEISQKLESAVIRTINSKGGSQVTIDMVVYDSRIHLD